MQDSAAGSDSFSEEECSEDSLSQVDDVEEDKFWEEVDAQLAIADEHDPKSRLSSLFCRMTILGIVGGGSRSRCSKTLVPDHVWIQAC